MKFNLVAHKDGKNKLLKPFFIFFLLFFRRNRTPPKSINGKMPSVANSPSSEAIITDGMANMVLEKLPYPVGSKITAKLNTGAPAMKGEIVAFDPKLKVVIISKFKKIFND